MCQIEIVLICLKKKPHCNPVSVRLVCVCINERRLICLCAHFAHLCMDRS